MNAPLWRSEALALACGGRAQGAPFVAEGVSIDTRTLQQGDVFVALQGARDGASFIAEARSRGAAGVLSQTPFDGPGVRVEDAARALEALGRAARRRAVGARRAAVTGSVGKTSVVQALASALARSGACHASVRSYNNHIGVPLTLARMPAAARFGVFEVGMNHAGEIAPLSRMIEPEVAVVTTIGPAHIENFADGEAGVARAKAEIFEGLQPGGAAVLNRDAPFYDTLAQAADAAGARVLRFGSGEDCEGRLLGAATFAGGLQVEAELMGRRLSYRLPQSGAPFGYNSLAALLTVQALGADVEAAVGALEAFGPLAGRGERRRLDLGGRRVLLIDESYNANPLSMRAALSALAAETAGRRVAILTDMLEMGERSEALHRGLAEPLLEAGVGAVFLAGPGMRALHDALSGSLPSVWRESARALEPVALDGLRDGDVVMVKGSNGSSAGRLVQTLIAAASPARETE